MFGHKVEVSQKKTSIRMEWTKVQLKQPQTCEDESANNLMPMAREVTAPISHENAVLKDQGGNP